MQKNLKRAAIHGSIWSFGAQGLRFVCQLTSTIVLARILLPSDFGVVASLTSFIAIIAGMRNLGLSSAIVQTDKLTVPVTNTLFVFSIFLALMFGLFVIMSGYFVAWMVGDGRIIGLGYLLFIGSCFTVLESVPLGLLRRKLLFRQIAQRDIIIALLVAGLSLLIAYQGGGYWALVIPTTIGTLVSLVMSLKASGWMPSLNCSSIKESLPIIKFGSTMAFSTMASNITQNIDQTILARYAGVTELGYYSRSKALLNGTVQQTLGPVASILIPILSRLRDDPPKLESWLSRLSMMVVVASAPLSALLMFSSSQLVEIVLGDQWLASAPIFQVLALGVFLMSYGGFLYWILVATGNAKILMKSTWIGAFFSVLAVLVGIKWGAVGVACASIGIGISLRALVLIYLVNSTGRVPAGLLIVSYMKGIVELGSWVLCIYLLSNFVEKWIHIPILYILVMTALTAILFHVRLFSTVKGRELLMWFKNSLLEDVFEKNSRV